MDQLLDKHEGRLRDAADKAAAEISTYNACCKLIGKMAWDKVRKQQTTQTYLSVSEAIQPLLDSAIVGDDAGKLIAREVPTSDLLRLLAYGERADAPATRRLLIESYRRDWSRKEERRMMEQQASSLQMIAQRIGQAGDAQTFTV